MHRRLSISNPNDYYYPPAVRALIAQSRAKLDAPSPVAPILHVPASEQILPTSSLKPTLTSLDTLRYVPSSELFNDESIIDDFVDEDDQSPEAQLQRKLKESTPEGQLKKKAGSLPCRDGRFTLFDTPGQKSNLVLSKADADHLKNVRFREQYLLQHFNLSVETTDVSERMKVLRFLSVSPNTFRGYASHWNVLKAYDCKIDFGAEGLQRFLAIRRRTLSNSSLVHWCSAVKFYLMATGHSSFSDEQLCRTLCRGYCYDNPSGLAKERGVINRGKLDLIVNSPCVSKTIYKLGFRVQFAFGLRTSQMNQICASDIRTIMDNKGKSIIGYAYVTIKHKDMNAHLRQSHECHIVDAPDVSLITELLALPRASDLLFPSWNASEANSLIKQVADFYSWDPNLEWVNHGLRHGACLEAADLSADQSIAGRVEAGQRRTNQKSFNVVHGTYLKSEDAREIAAVARKALTGSNKSISSPAPGTVVRRSRLRLRVSLSSVASVADPNLKNEDRRKVAATVTRVQQKKSKGENGVPNLDNFEAIARRVAKDNAQSQNALSTDGAPTAVKPKRKYTRRAKLADRDPAAISNFMQRFTSEM
jgi:hypothetical protein